MSHKPIPICTVDKKGRVVCPTCGFKTPVPETHALSVGMGKCPMNHDFLVDDVAVEAFHHFLGKSNQHSKHLLKNHEEMVKEIKETLTQGGIILPPGVDPK